MATIKIKLRLSSGTAKTDVGTICYVINYERRVRILSTDCRLRVHEWDAKRSLAIVPEGANSAHVTRIREINRQIRLDVKLLTRIIQRCTDDAVTYTVDDVANEYRRYCSEYTLFNYANREIERLRATGRIRTSETYTSALKNIRKYMQNKDVRLDCLSADLIESYQVWLKARGVVMNTVSFYMRILRAIYNRAVDAGIIINRSPFKNVYTGVDKTVKRALPLEVIRRIRQLDLSESRSLRYARDMFMLSFYLRGMSFIDMAYLKKSDLNHGMLRYRRRKTGQLLTIEWTAEMQTIVDRYPLNPTGYLLPIITRTACNDRSTYRNRGYSINRHLKQIAAMVGIDVPLTMYVARHSWASAAQAKGIPVSIISEGMGHDSEATTRIYLASLDTSVVDRANRLILSSL